VIDVFVDELDLAERGFSGVDPEATARPSYNPSVLLKLYIYGYLNRVQSSRQIEESVGPLSPAARQRRSARAIAGQHDQDDQDGSPEREDREAERGGAAPPITRGADARQPGPADIAERS
jgi:hypothetical protein